MGKYAITGTALKELFGQMATMDPFSRHKQFMMLYKRGSAPEVVSVVHVLLWRPVSRRGR